MTEALTILAAIALVAAFVRGLALSHRLNRAMEELTIADEKLLEAVNEYWTATKALNNLRRNAFLTDERGVRVKYANASRDVRDRAEAN